MKLLDDYFKLQKEIYDYFGYKEDSDMFPSIKDSREMYWQLGGKKTNGCVTFADTLKKVKSFYNPNVCETCNETYKEIQVKKHCLKRVYRNKDYTAVCVPASNGGDGFLQIFTNSKEVKEGIFGL